MVLSKFCVVCLTALSLCLANCQASNTEGASMVLDKYKAGDASVWLCATNRKVALKKELGMQLKPIVKAEAFKLHLEAMGAIILQGIQDLGPTKCPDLIKGQTLTSFDVKGKTDAYSYVPHYRVYVKSDGLIHLIESF